MELLALYHRLLKEFGPRGWWPVRRDFRPKEWEICMGTVLTQNTSWRNVERALDNLSANGILTPEDVLETGKEALENLIRPSGYYRQKAERLKGLAKFVLGYGGFETFRKNVKREDLLEVKGIGLETCDSILLYACGQAYFVIDSYTRRLVGSLGIKASDYESLRGLFESSLPKDVDLYKEFHALIVEWGKRYSARARKTRNITSNRTPKTRNKTRKTQKNTHSDLPPDR